MPIVIYESDFLFLKIISGAQDLIFLKIEWKYSLKKKGLEGKQKGNRITILFFISLLDYSEFCHFYNEEMIIKVVDFGPVVALIIWDLVFKLRIEFLERIRENLGRNFRKKTPKCI